MKSCDLQSFRIDNGKLSPSRMVRLAASSFAYVSGSGAVVLGNVAPEDQPLTLQKLVPGYKPERWERSGQLKVEGPGKSLTAGRVEAASIALGRSTSLSHLEREAQRLFEQSNYLVLGMQLGKRPFWSSRRLRRLLGEALALSRLSLILYAPDDAILPPDFAEYSRRLRLRSRSRALQRKLDSTCDVVRDLLNDRHHKRLESLEIGIIALMLLDILFLV